MLFCCDLQIHGPVYPSAEQFKWKQWQTSPQDSDKPNRINRSHMEADQLQTSAPVKTKAASEPSQ